ncbi:uncharacterized protein [Dendrobates tinctorius]|uniref:uncharacterized protein n=1 Tax=Dendrobates tinctorius TaxID=92724 RepID=UPI003CCA2C7B
MGEDSSQENSVPAPHTPPPGPHPQAGPSAAAPSAIQEEQGNISSSPTAQIRGSPQPAGPSRRGRRCQIPAQDTRTIVDTGVLNYLARVNNDGEEAYSRSLALYLRALSPEVRLRIRGCFQILLDASTHPNTPYELFEYLERWQLSPRNLMRLRHPTYMLAQAGSEDPQIRGPTPHPLSPPTQPFLQQPHMSGSSQPHQYGHLLPPSVGGWSQPGWGRHGYFDGYETRAYQPQQEAPLQYHSGQYQPQSQEAVHYPHHGQQYAPTQGAGLLLPRPTKIYNVAILVLPNGYVVVLFVRKCYLYPIFTSAQKPIWPIATFFIWQ